MNKLLKLTSVSLLALSVSAHADAPQRVVADDLIKHFETLEQLGGDSASLGRISDLANSVDSSKYNHFVTAIGEHYLRGERDRIDFPIYLLAEDAAASIDLQVGFLNSAVVRPETSRVKLLVNGRAVAARPLKYAAKEGILSAQVPPQLLRPGKNMVSVAVEQTHRVDCSYRGTFDLWTRINPQNTYVKYNTQERPFRSLRDLAGLPREFGAGENITLLVPEDGPIGTGTAAVTRHLDLVQDVVLNGSYKNPKVEVTTDLVDLRSSGPSLDLYVGDANALLNLPGLQTVYAPEAVRQAIAQSAGGLAIVPSVNGKRHLVVQRGGSLEAPSGFNFFEEIEETETAETFDQRYVTLTEAGYVEQPHFGKRFTTSLNLEMPATFYPSDYDSVKLHLFATYAKDLAPRQNLQIKVNGVDAANLALHSGTRGIFDNKVIEIPLSAFAPGHNEVEFIAQLDTENGSTCNYGQFQNDGPSFFVSGESFFTIPKLAQLKRFPDIENTLSTGFPYRQEDGRGALEVQIDPTSESALQLAAEFVARAAINAEQKLPISVFDEFTAQNTSGANRLVVTSFDGVPTRYVRHYQGVDFAALSNFWSTQFAAADVDELSTTALPPISINDGIEAAENELPQIDFLGAAIQPVDDIAAPRQQNLGSEVNAISERLKARAKRQRGGDGWLPFENGFGSIKSKFNALTASQSDRSAKSRLAAQETNIVISQFADDGAVTTLIAYPGNQTASLAAFDLSRVRGGNLTHSMGFSVIKKETTTLQAKHFDVRQIDFSSFSNVRLVAAGWLSNNPSVYGVIFLIVLLGCGFCSSLMLSATNRSAGKEFDREH